MKFVEFSVMRKESTPRYTQLEIYLFNITLTSVAIGLHIGLVQGVITGLLQSFTQAQKVIRIDEM
jgi:thiamine transporter ThiT